MVVQQSADPDQLYADVIVPRHLSGPFTYRVSRPLQSILEVGHRVLVPFGRALVQGAVVALNRQLPRGIDRARLKDIAQLAADRAESKIPDDLLTLARLVAEDYVAPLGQCLRLVVPPSGSPSRSSTKLIVTEQGQAAMAAGLDEGEDTTILKRLSRRKTGILRRTVEGGRARSRALIAQWIERGWIAEVETAAASAGQETARALDPHWGRCAEEPVPAAIVTQFDDRLQRTILAATSDKLIIQAPLPQRMALLRHMVSQRAQHQRALLVLVGEAKRAEWVASHLSQTEGSTVCWHSGLSDDRRAAMWRAVQRQEIRVVVGTRSAVFLPFRNLMAIWVEQEEDPAFKEPQEPHYHVREVAWMRAQEHRALLLLASSHPSMESSVEGERSGCLLKAPTPSEAGPHVQIVDLRQQDRSTLLSPPLIDALRKSVAQRSGALLFLNRKGYAGALICRDCGQVPRCPACQVPLTYHRQAGRLVCAYCGHVASTPETCPACGGARLQPIGEGTERVEEEVRTLFPQAAIVRVDGNSMKRPAQAEAIWSRIARHEWDVLIGTQLLLDERVPSVGVIGVVQADASLNRPDFRAAERTYHQLLDVTAFAKGALDGGRVIIQTYLPSHHAIQAVARRDASLFLADELHHRTALGYPPSVSLVVLHCSGFNEKLVHEAATGWVKKLAEQGGDLTILGPIPPPLPKLRGRYRRQILVKARDRAAGIRAVRTTVSAQEAHYPARSVKFDVDVDPVEMW